VARGDRAARLVLSEETLEMLGSTLFAAAFAVLAVSAVMAVQRH
jgi:hypothetical protein